MSSRSESRRRPDPANPANGSGAGDNLVQSLLAERRELMVANERLKLELEERTARTRGPDARTHRLEDEVRRLRQELATARAQRDQARQECDGLRSGVESALQELRRAR
jgi:chromosome segregation ATPase